MLASDERHTWQMHRITSEFHAKNVHLLGVPFCRQLLRRLCLHSALLAMLHMSAAVDRECGCVWLCVRV